MVVDAIYNDNSRKENIKKYKILNGTGLPLKQTKIDLSYIEKGVTVYTDTPIRVELISESSNPEEPTIPEVPSTPSMPEPTSPTVIEKEPENVEIKKEPTIKADENNKEEVLQEVKDTNLSTGAILSGVGLFLIILFILLSNVKVYSKEIDGEWKYLGKTRALKARENYVVRISKLLRIRAESNSYKLIFSKAFKKTHEECDVLVKVDQTDYEKKLAKDSNTILVDHKE